MSDKTEGGAPVAKKRRTNWYADDENYLKLKKAAECYIKTKKKEPKLSVKNSVRVTCPPMEYMTVYCGDISPSRGGKDLDKDDSINVISY